MNDSCLLGIAAISRRIKSSEKRAFCSLSQTTASLIDLACLYAFPRDFRLPLNLSSRPLPSFHNKKHQKIQSSLCICILKREKYTKYLLTVDRCPLDTDLNDLLHCESWPFYWIWSLPRPLPISFWQSLSTPSPPHSPRILYSLETQTVILRHKDKEMSGKEIQHQIFHFNHRLPPPSHSPLSLGQSFSRLVCPFIAV